MGEEAVSGDGDSLARVGWEIETDERLAEEE